MKPPFVSRRRHERDLAFVNADRERLRGERNQFAQDRDTAKYNREQILRQLAEADAANRRLAGRNRELTERLAACNAEKERADAETFRADIEVWERRVKAHDRWMPPADLDKRPIGGGTSRPTHPAVDLRRALERCRELESRLAVAEGRTRKGAAS